MKPRQLICFDLGRVLVRICGDWTEAHARTGLDGEPPRVGPDHHRAISAEVHAFEIGARTAEQFAAACARVLGVAPATLHAMLDAWVVGATNGATQLLDDLRAAGHAIACLSNTNARHWSLMAGWAEEADRIFPRLGLRYASHELGLRKPDPAIYAEVEARSGFTGSQIVFFDDLHDNVVAARARGWRAVTVEDLADPVAHMREWLRRNGLL